MGNDTKVNAIISELERNSASNTGQKSVYLNDSVAIIQRRVANNYIIYFFDDKDSLLELDIRDSSHSQNFTREELFSFLNKELAE
jgi:hypothetical protein